MHSRRDGLVVAAYILAILIALADCLASAAIRLWGGPPDHWTLNLFLYGSLFTIPALYLSFHRNAYAPVAAALAAGVTWTGLVLSIQRGERYTAFTILTTLRDTVFEPLILAPLVMAALLYFIARMRGEIEGT